MTPAEPRSGACKEMAQLIWNRIWNRSTTCAVNRPAFGTDGSERLVVFDAQDPTVTSWSLVLAPELRRAQRRVKGS